MRALLGAGADPDVRNLSGATALDLAKSCVVSKTRHSVRYAKAFLYPRPFQVHFPSSPSSRLRPLVSQTPNLGVGEGTVCQGPTLDAACPWQVQPCSRCCATYQHLESVTSPQALLASAVLASDVGGVKRALEKGADVDACLFCGRDSAQVRGRRPREWL